LGKELFANAIAHYQELKNNVFEMFIFVVCTFFMYLDLTFL